MRSYGELWDLTDLAMKHSDKPCIGDECDGETNCKRHSRTIAVVERLHNIRKARR